MRQRREHGAQPARIAQNTTESPRAHYAKTKRAHAPHERVSVGRVAAAGVRQQAACLAHHRPCFIIHKEERGRPAVLHERHNGIRQRRQRGAPGKLGRSDVGETLLQEAGARGGDRLGRQAAARARERRAGVRAGGGGGCGDEACSAKDTRARSVAVCVHVACVACVRVWGPCVRGGAHRSGAHAASYAASPTRSAGHSARQYAALRTSSGDATDA
jgi:hypothetical protein